MMRKLAFVLPVILLAGCSDDGSDTATPTEPTVASTDVAPVPTTTEPASAGSIEEAFSFADDALCEWVSEAEVAEFVSEAYSRSGIEWERTVSAVDPVGSAWDLPGSDYCRWEPTGGGHVIARGLTTSDFGPVIDYSEWDQQSVLPTVSGHPGVPDGTIAASAAFGRYGFWLEGSNEVLGLEVVLEGGIPPNSEQQEEMLFVVANGFLTELGWTP